MPTQINQTPARPARENLRHRSKGGCVDCKTAKVRCDEVRPSCGTCARRKRRCQGYHPLPGGGPRSLERKQRFIFYHPTDVKKRLPLENSNSPINLRTPSPEATAIEAAVQESGDRSLSSSSTMGLRSDVEPPSNRFEVLERPESMALDLTISCESTTSFPPIPQSVYGIPPGTIPAEDAEMIRLYFSRHPSEQVISLEFVDEMNASTWMIFQYSPKAVVEALCCIGSVYLEEHSRRALIPLTITKRARALTTLKAKDPSHELELMLLMSLALGAMEGIDTRCQPHERTSSILIAYATSIINRYMESGRILSSLAKYFIRALARHDMIMSLSHLRRNSIRTEIWLDNTAHTPDRFMGYTTTLMPLLEELCGLAEDIHCNAGPTQAATYRRDTTWSIARKVRHLRSHIRSWQCGFPKGPSAASLERLMAHAEAYRAAALLMLFRLLHSAGSSVESDRTALKMAGEVMLQLKRAPEDLGLSTWPALIASCEFQSEKDRFVAINVFWSIYNVRKTGTCLQTLNFVTERVWRARDEGRGWDWMTLSRQYPGECVPI
ncbi:hypothetical protein GQ53DRAFT_86545 [Thozetella sp. PMI_491]|nr:hypothetical protein GQ53DRAFT_86545 [Thozetella sp. PMI_491]